MANSSSNLKVRSFLDLPAEIRQQIYEQIIPVCRLAPFPYIDPAWSMIPEATSEHRGIPDFLFLSRQFYNDVAPLIYSKAILEIAPAPQSYSYFEVKIASIQKVVPYTYTRLSNMFRFYRSDLLRLVRNVHVYSNQQDAIDDTSYEAMLQWLVEHTEVITIYLSPRPMTRIRANSKFDLASWRSAFYDDGKSWLAKRDLRIVRVWTKFKRRPWEWEKMMRLRCSPTNGTLNPIQIYFWFLDPTTRDDSDAQNNSEGQINSTLHLDPRWITRLDAEPEKIEIMKVGSRMIDEVMNNVLEGREKESYKDNARHIEGDAWIYQMILISR